MANAYTTNYNTTNGFEILWKTTRVMKTAGWNTVACSNGVTFISNANNSTDSWGNNVNPLADVYPTSFNTSAAWIVMRGPSTLKIALAANPTGNLVRGETITQASTLAEGELMGYVWDGYTSSGYAVVSPRTGTFNNSNLITGSLSGGTFSPTAVTTYVREVMFMKEAATTYRGAIFYICANTSTESAQLYSSIAASASATVGPGQGSSGNAFPTNGLLVRGTRSSSSATEWFVINGFGTNHQIMASNAIASTGVSADGSFTICVTSNNSTNIGYFSGIQFSRVDDGEPGDVDPYVWCVPNQWGFNSWQNNSATSYGSFQMTFHPGAIYSISYPYFLGYAARGCPVTSRDVIAPYTSALLHFDITSGRFIVSTNNIPVVLRDLNHPSTGPLSLEPLVMYNPGSTGTITSQRQNKGKLRWMYATYGVNTLETLNGKKLIAISPLSNNAAFPTIVVGPYDGVTNAQF